MRPKSRRPIAMLALLVGASVMFAGCGDEGAHLPAGMTGSSAALVTTAGSDSILDNDPGQLDTTLTSNLEDPVLQDASLDTLDAADDPWAAASSDWDEHEGSVAASFSNDALDDVAFDDDFTPVGNYGSSYDDGWGVGSGITSMASVSAGAMIDPSFEDPGVMDAGIDDAGIDDAGVMDAGFDDPAMAADDPIVF